MSVPVVRFKILLVVCAIFLVAWIGWIEFISGRGIFSYSHHSSARFAVADPASHSNSFKKPTGFKIIGLVFYGRKQTVSILDCYLKVLPPISVNRRFATLQLTDGWLDM